MTYKKLGTDFDGLEMFETFPGARTFPQIIVDGEKIGGYMDYEKFVKGDTND
jgi:glutaredoxin